MDGPLDLLHGATERVIGVYLLDTEDGPALFDCGPSSCLDALRARLAERGLEIGDLRHLLLSHIHLDHAGASGPLVRENPGLQVHVSKVGAPHLVDPGRLERSARRLYGDAFDTLWGELAPVPEANVHVVGGRVLGLDCFPSPGHASHHVCYLDDEGTIYSGDAAGVRLLPAGSALPVSPPPDIDVEAWHRTLDAIEERDPQGLALIHFGLVTDVSEHLGQLRKRLDEWARRARDEDEETWVRTSRRDLEAAEGDDADRYRAGRPPLAVVRRAEALLGQAVAGLIATEYAELAALRDLVAAAPAEVARELELAAHEVGGAFCVRSGALPGARELNRVLGLGLDEPATDELLDEVGRFFEGITFFVQLAPGTQPPDLETRLAARGYVRDYAWAKFDRPAEAVPEPPTDLRLELVGREGGEDVGATFVAGYGLPESMVPWFSAVPGRDGWSCYVAYDGAAPAGCGLLFAAGGAGWLGGAATLPEFRGRGAQTAMLAARIHRAAELGCEVVVTETGEQVADLPSRSYRNIERAGFELCYLRPNLRSPG